MTQQQMDKYDKLKELIKKEEARVVSLNGKVKKIEEKIDTYIDKINAIVHAEKDRVAYPGPMYRFKTT